MINKSFTVLLIFLISFVANYQINAVEIDKLNPISKIKIKSELFPDGIEFNITLPQSYESKIDKRYILLLDFHPRSQLYLSGLHDWLSHNGGKPWLETLVITPSGGSNLWNIINSINSKEGGSELLDFIEQDVLAAIDKKYRTNGFRILNGFTYNASLSLYTLYHRPNLFNAYIAVSPQLTDNYAKLLSKAEEKLKLLSDKPRYLFLSTGNSDNDTFNSLSKTIKSAAPKQLQLQIKYYDEYSYMSQPILALVNTIEDLFSDIHNDLKPDSEISRQGVKAILKHYKYLSEEKFGFHVSAEGSLIDLGFSIFEESPEEALSILNTVVETYPDSANAYHSLAKAYAELGQFEKAVEYQIQANQRAQNLIRWYKEKHKRALDEYQAALLKSKGEK
ncbi:MAG: tetratricopeptide repeat protein [Maribacter sp.]|nr:tetratricopeptide repeat protein [Maribacter sp.]